MTWKQSTLYPKVFLKHLLSKSEEWIEPKAEEKYQLLTVRMWGKGIVERGIIKGSEIAAKRMFVVRPQQFIISRIDARHGASGVIPEKFDGAIITNEFPIFNTNPSKIIPEYLNWLSKTPDFIELCKVASEGTTNRVRLKEDKFLNLEIPLPSLEEQRRIVARIQELETAIAEARGLRKQSLEETELFAAKAIQQIFQKHCDSTTLIGNVFRVTTGGTPARHDPSYWDGDVNWVSSGEVAFCRIKDTSERITDLGVANSNAKINPPGTVLLAMIGQGKTRGQCAILDCYAANNQNVAAIHVYETFHNPEYVYWWLYSRYQESRAIETGTAQPALSGERVKKILIPIPSLSEQKQIVTYLDNLQSKIDTLKHLQTETAAELDALLPSILDKAFKGEL